MHFLARPTGDRFKLQSLSLAEYMPALLIKTWSRRRALLTSWELVRKAESEIYRIRIYVFHKSPWLISMHDEGPSSSRTIPRAWFSVIFAPTPQIENWEAFETSVDSSRAKENHSNHLSCFLSWLSMLLPMPSTLPATVVTKRLIVLREFIFSGHVSLTSTNKQDLMNLLSVNSFPWLVNKCVPQNLTLIAVPSSGTFSVW